MEANTSKKCRRCGKELPLSEFYTNPSMKDGHVNICKRCHCLRLKKVYKQVSPKENVVKPAFIEELKDYTERELLGHLAALGYMGTLEYVSTVRL